MYHKWRCLHLSHLYSHIEESRIPWVNTLSYDPSFIWWLTLPTVRSLTKVLLELVGKTTLIDIEVVNSQINDNILLGCSYMYTMQVITSTVFHLIMFSHNGKIIIICHLTYYDCKASITPYNVLLDTKGNHSMPTSSKVFLGVYIDPSLIGSFFGPSPQVPPKDMY